jgi:hypothetical protein
VDFSVIKKGTSRNRTRTNGNDNLRRRHGRIGFRERQVHISGHRSRDEQPIRVPRGGHELNAEAPEVEHHRIEHVDLGLAGVAAAGTDLPQLE